MRARRDAKFVHKCETRRDWASKIQEFSWLLYISLQRQVWEYKLLLRSIIICKLNFNFDLIMIGVNTINIGSDFLLFWYNSA
jgi:hypothetical protein